MRACNRWAGEGRQAWHARCALVVLCLLALGSAPWPASAGIALRTGDFVIGATYHLSALSREGGSIFVLSSNPSFEIPHLLATGPGGQVYVADNYFGTPDQRAVVRLDPVTWEPTIVASGGFGFITGITLEPSGKLLIVDAGGSQIVRVDPSTGSRTMVSLGGKLHNPQDVAIEADGSLLTTVATVANGPTTTPRQILRIQAGTNAQEIVSAGGLFVTPQWLAVAADGTIFTSDTGGNTTPDRVLRVHPQTGGQALVAEFGPGVLAGLVMDASGTLFAGHWDGVYRVDTNSGHTIRVGTVNGADVPGKLAIFSAPVVCSPRPRVQVHTSNLGSGRLQVNLTTSGEGNTIRVVRAGAPQNAALVGQPVLNGAQATLVVQRTGSGYVTLPVTVTDGCGDWSTFVGGGPSAF